MYDFRKKACEDVKKVFGLDWSVKKSIEYVSRETLESETLESEENNDTND